MTRIVVSVMVSIVSLAGCKKDPVAAARDDEKRAAPSVAPSAVATPAAAAPAPQLGATATPQGLPPNAPKTWMGKLAEEAKARPAGALRADAVLEAVEKSGSALAMKFQSLATLAKAKYCMSARTQGGVGLAVCEYESADAAKAGRAHSLERYKVIPRRDIRINGQTTLTITRSTDAPAQSAEGERIAKVFDALR